jgi:hypothetical protein
MEKIKHFAYWGILASSLFSISGMAAPLTVYPAKGQSAEKQAADVAACQQFAKSQTGFDPQQALGSTPAPEQPPPAVRARKRAKEEQKELSQQKQQQQQMQQKLDAYNKAEAVCLQGRGYSVG